MSIAINLLRTLRNTCFRLRHIALIADISDDNFKKIFHRLVIDGWVLASKYDGFDAGIDYDCLKMRKGLETVKCEWNNWTEWEILGRRDLVERIAIEFDLQVSYF